MKDIKEMKPSEKFGIIKTYVETNVCDGCMSNNAKEGYVPNCDKCPLKMCIRDLEKPLERFDKYIPYYTESFEDLVDTCCEMLDDDWSNA